MNRRTFLAAASAVTAVQSAPPRSRMGIATTSFAVYRAKTTLDFLEHCNSLGAGGIQSALNPLDSASMTKLRERAEQLGMFIEAMTPIPRDGTERFESAVKAAKEAGALCVRVACLSGRRYETFDTLEEWKKFAADSKAALERALPILERHKVRMAVENHKDWTAEEFLALLKQYSTEYFGACLDTGNNIALLDDAHEFAEAIAPYAVSTHIKDMGVKEYDEGFLLSEAPLGEGYVDLKGIVAAVRKHRPDTRFSLEMMTRNPLKVPCLTGKYWVTLPGREGRLLARTLATVRKKTTNQPLPSVDNLDQPARARYEEDNVKQCLNYAREQLGV